MTNNEIRSMQERQLARLENLSEKTARSRDLVGLTGAMLAVSRRLERMQEADGDGGHE